MDGRFHDIYGCHPQTMLSKGKFNMTLKQIKGDMLSRWWSSGRIVPCHTELSSAVADRYRPGFDSRPTKKLLDKCFYLVGSQLIHKCTTGQAAREHLRGRGRCLLRHHY